MKHIDNFYSLLEQTSSGKQYILLIDSIRVKNRGKKVVNDGYEKHHIRPAALGGKNVEENYIKLTVFEHCLAHLLLAQAIPCNETILPIQKMAGKLQDNLTVQEITELNVKGWARAREEALRVVAKNNVEKAKNVKWRQKVSAALQNRVTIHLGDQEKRVQEEELQRWLSEGWIKGRSERLKKIIAERNRAKALDPEFRKKLSEATKKAHQEIESYNSKISAAMKKHVRTEEHVRKLHEAHVRNSANVDRNRRIAETLKNKVTITDGTHNRHVNPSDLGKWLEQGWYRGFVRVKVKNSHDS